MAEQVYLFALGQENFSHSVIKGQEPIAPVFERELGSDAVLNSSFDPHDGFDAGDMEDVRSFARPGRNGARTGYYPKMFTVEVGLSRRTVIEEIVQNPAFFHGELALDFQKMDKACRYRVDLGDRSLEEDQQFAQAESRKSAGARQLQQKGHRFKNALKWLGFV
jgi:hypothetical protein